MHILLSKIDHAVYGDMFHALFGGTVLGGVGSGTPFDRGYFGNHILLAHEPRTGGLYVAVGIGW